MLVGSDNGNSSEKNSCSAILSRLRRDLGSDFNSLVMRSFPAGLIGTCSGKA